MSTVSKFVCDFCGEETDDQQSYIGWISINGPGTFFLFQGRTSNKDPKGIAFPLDKLDFCSLSCFEKYIVKKTVEKPKRKRTK